MSGAHSTEPMIRANCRNRFTVQDFDFVVKTLGRSRGDAVSLGEMLTDAGERDSILDHQLLFDAVLSQPAHLAISPQFYFYILTRHVLNETGIDDRLLADYVASLLENFSRTARMNAPVEQQEGPIQYLSDMLLALRTATPAQTFFIRAHVGNYSLFITGIFHECVARRSRRGGPDCSFYEEMGRSSFKRAASHEVARSAELSGVYEVLGEQFHGVRLALNRLADQLINLDDAGSSNILLA